jgi:hypothetical protein
MKGQSPSTAVLLTPPPVTEQLPDIRVQVIFYMFAGNVAFWTAVLLLAAIPYYHYFGNAATKAGFAVLSCASAVLYVMLALAVSMERAQMALLTLGAFTVAFALLVGVVCAMLYNIALIQLACIYWLQALTVVAYTRVSPRVISIPKAGWMMAAATVVGWCSAIYGFVVERDWPYAAAIAVLGLAMVPYAHAQMQRTEGRYDASWEQGVMAVCRYYCDDAANALAALGGNRETDA